MEQHMTNTLKNYLRGEIFKEIHDTKRRNCDWTETHQSFGMSIYSASAEQFADQIKNYPTVFAKCSFSKHVDIALF